MIIGSYETKRGKRYRLELRTGKTIRGLTMNEVHDIWEGIVARQRANRGIDNVRRDTN